MSAMEVLTPEQSQVSVTAGMSKWFDNIMSQIIKALLLMDLPFQTATRVGLLYWFEVRQISTIRRSRLFLWSSPMVRDDSFNS